MKALSPPIRNIIFSIEFLLLFFGVPTLIFFDRNIIHPSSILLPILVALILYFRKQKDFKWHDLIRLDISRRMLWKQIVIQVITTALLLALVMICEPEQVFNLPKGNPTIWLALLFFYPIFSAYPQEVVYRMFLFRRYAPLFRKKWIIVLASGISFSFVHIVYFSWLSLILTFFAGLYLAWVYDKTKSVLLTSILHGLFGNLIFTVGLGHHFWLDMFDWL